MGKSSSLSDSLVRRARETLLGLPGVVEVRLVLEPLQDGSQFDALLEVVAGRHQVVRVPVEVQARGYPQNVRQAANRLAWHRNRSKAHAVTPLLIAPSLSPGSRKLLQDLDVGYWDSGGSLYLKLNDSVFLVDRPAPPVERRRTRGLFRGASAQVLHQLLLEPGRAWRGNELAEKAGVSAYTVHLVLQYLEEQLLVERDEKGPKMLRSLQEPGALLEAWAESHSLEDYESHPLHVVAGSPEERERIVLELLESCQVEYALTLEAGAMRVAPHGTGVGVLSVLVPADLDWEEITRGTRLKPVQDGANTILMAPRRGTAPLMGRREIEGVWVASDVQLYLDLWNWPRRGREQAKHLRTERLPY